MELYNFEECMEDKILERGKEYFYDGRIDEVREIDPYCYLVKVIGSEYYTVEIIIDSETIVDTSCDCPYDFGEYCKHQAAAFFALRDIRSGKDGNIKPSTENKKTDIKTILSGLPKDELISIISTIASDYPEIEKKVVFTYAPVEDEILSSKQLINEYINMYKQRGFIGWNDVSNALQGAEMTLEKVNEKIAKGEIQIAVSLCIAVLSKVIEMLEYSDDSSGYVGEVIVESLQLIEDSVSSSIEKMKENQKEILFTTIMKEANHDRYEGWIDWKISLYRSCIFLCDSTERRNKLERGFNMMLEKLSDDDSWSANYERENIKHIQLELIERYDGEEKSDQFITENMNYSLFREMAIERLLEKEDYQEVVHLSEKGQKEDKEYLGLVNKWKKYQLQAYEGLSDIKKQRELMLEFLYRNEYEYYAKLKKLYQPNEWEIVLQEVLDTFNKQSYIPSAYVEILKEENLTDRLVEYCKKNLFSIIDIYPYLLKDYFDEVNELFVKYISEEARESNDRKKYRNVCKIIKLYKKACGSVQAQALIDELKQTFNRRPAFIDELSKI